MRRIVITVPSAGADVVEVLVVDDGDRTAVDVRPEGGIWQPLALAGGHMRQEIG